MGINNNLTFFTPWPDMNLLNKQLLCDFKEKHADAQSQLDSWEAEVEEARWNTPHELKHKYPKASILSGRHVIFDICGNNYRLWVQISYKNGVVFIKKVGTHKEYDNWHII